MLGKNPSGESNENGKKMAWQWRWVMLFDASLLSGGPAKAFQTVEEKG